MISKLNSSYNIRKQKIENMLENDYIDYSNSSITKVNNKLNNFDTDYITKQTKSSYYKSKKINDDVDNILSDFPQYDSILFLLTKTSQFIKTQNRDFKHEIYFNLGKLYQLLPESYQSKIILNKSFLDIDNWKESYTLIEEVIKEITHYT